MGKTSFITQLIPLLNAQGIRVSVIKHAHHQFDIDHPGKDSFNIREAGAVQTLIASSRRWALMTETPNQQQDTDLSHLLKQLDTHHADLILVEGFKTSHIPKIEVYRPSMRQPLLATHDTTIMAVATDEPINTNTTQLPLNKPQDACAFIINWMQNLL